jgi:hypothetical protein
MNQHAITLQLAETLTHAYQNSPDFQGLTIACKIDKDAYQELINQVGCAGVRTYFAINETDDLTIVVVGVDQSGNDITDGIILNKGLNCPTNCGNNSSLMI